MKNKYFHKLLIIIGTIIIAATSNPVAAQSSIKLASTTSTQNSGLFDHILPLFEKETGIKVHVIAVGTGAAIRLARSGDADVLMVHHQPSETKFVAEGYGIERFDLMYNDFVLIGPTENPAELSQTDSITSALTKIAAGQHIFLSRGDDSGTHKKERELWTSTDIDIEQASGHWYREAGSGMGATLNNAVAMNGYTLSDRATWVSFKNKQNHRILFEGDKQLHNQYGVILGNPEKFSQIQAGAGQHFIDWLLSNRGQQAIANFTVDGQQLFTPNAKK